MSTSAQRIIAAGASLQFRSVAPPTPGVMAIANAETGGPQSCAYFSRTGNLGDWFPSDLPPDYPRRVVYDAKRRKMIVVFDTRCHVTKNGINFGPAIPFTGMGQIVDMAIFNNPGPIQGRWFVLSRYDGAWWSDDEGVTWTKSNLPAPLVAGNNEYIRARYAENNNRIYISVDGTRMYRTDDGNTVTPFSTLLATGRWHDCFGCPSALYPNLVIYLAYRTASNIARSTNGDTIGAAAQQSPQMTPYSGDRYRLNAMVLSRAQDLGNDVYNVASSGATATLLSGGGPNGHLKWVPALDHLYVAQGLGNVWRKIGTTARVDVLPIRGYWQGVEHATLIGF